VSTPNPTHIDTERGHLREELRARVIDGLHEMGWTQRDLAGRLKITEKHLSRVLVGRADASIEMWDRILQAVNR